MATGKVALVTGASSGIGNAIAKRLAEEGYAVIAAARRTDRMKDLEELGIETHALDVSKEESIAALVDHIGKKHGAVDVLVNNAGFGLYGAVEDIPQSAARYQLDVNLFGPARLIQLLLPAMRERRSGTIINMSSIGGKIYTPLGAWYHATKHALEGFSDCLRLELADYNINVVIVEPGAILTEFGSVMGDAVMKHSANGPYAGMAKKLAAVGKQTYEKGVGSPPGVIADVVVQAVRAKRPKTRYAAGKYAGMLLFIRKWFSDRFFDRTIMGMIK